MNASSVAVTYVDRTEAAADVRRRIRAIFIGSIGNLVECLEPQSLELADLRLRATELLDEVVELAAMVDG